MNPYQKLLSRKRTWTPVQTTAGQLIDGAEEAIYRALAIRHMELPVGDFITDALDNDVPTLAREVLLSNVKDEENQLMNKLRKKPNGSETLGLLIRITRSSRRLLPSVRFSLCYCPFSVLMEMRD
jgi:hypothetical protein